MRAIIGLVFLTVSVSAGTISNPSTALFFSSDQSFGTTSASLFGAIFGGYSLTGTACFDGYCNQVVNDVSQIQTVGTPVNDPLTVRLTNLTLLCVTQAGCGVAAVNANFSFGEISPSGTVNITVPLDGTAPAGTVVTLSGFAQSCNGGCIQVNIPGNTTVTADGNGILSGLFNLGNLTLIGTSKVSLGFSITGLGFNQSVILPSSLSLVYNAAAAVPEPATLSVMALGLGALGLLIRRRKK